MTATRHVSNALPSGSSHHPTAQQSNRPTHNVEEAAFIGAIVAETIAANSGIGYVMVVATNNMDVALAFAGLFVLSAMGVTLYLISNFAEKRLTGWAYRRH